MSDDSEAPESPKEVTFHYLKSNSFRVIHCDGVAGAWSPNGRFLHMALFSERMPIPIETVHRLEDGNLGAEISQTGRQGVVREVDVDVVLTRDIAEKIGKWLTKLVQDFPSNEEEQDG